jgi:hypothetical protein
VQEECLAELRRVQDEYQAKVEKIMGQVIAADTSKEHYRQKVRTLVCRLRADRVLIVSAVWLSLQVLQ